MAWAPAVPVATMATLRTNLLWPSCLIRVNKCGVPELEEDGLWANFHGTGRLTEITLDENTCARLSGIRLKQVSCVDFVPYIQQFIRQAVGYYNRASLFECLQIIQHG